MSLVLQVKWVEQSDQPEVHQRIRRIGGCSMKLQWEHTQAQAISAIEDRQFNYFVEKDGRPLNLKVEQTSEGQKYLAIQEEGGHPQVLLELPGFPDHGSVRPTMP